MHTYIHVWIGIIHTYICIYVRICYIISCDTVEEVQQWLFNNGQSENLPVLLSAGFCLSSTNVVLKAWRSPRELLFISLHQKPEVVLASVKEYQQE